MKQTVRIIKRIGSQIDSRSLSRTSFISMISTTSKLQENCMKENSMHLVQSWWFKTKRDQPLAHYCIGFLTDFVAKGNRRKVQIYTGGFRVHSCENQSGIRLVITAKFARGNFPFSNRVQMVKNVRQYIPTIFEFRILID